MKKRRTYKRAKDLKSAAIHARIRPDSLTLLRAMARRANLSPSAFMEHMIHVHARIELELKAAAERAAVEVANAMERAA